MAPNVLLVVLDTARADAFEPYGARAGATPAVAQLASRGTAVEHAYAPCCWTVPSHASLFTGLLPRSIGLAQVPGGQRHLCKPRMRAAADRNLPSVLTAAGYDCRGVSANLWVSDESGFADGFATFETVGTIRRGRMHDDGVKARLRWALEAYVAQADDGARAAGAVVDRWIDELPGRSDRPFFWFVNLMECHSPYLPPKPHNRLNPVQRVLAAADARQYLTFEEIAKACLGLVSIPEPAFKRMRVLYQDAVSYMDRWIGRVLEGLDSTGVLDETQVIVTSDHGENLGEQSRIGHALSLDERLIRVPLVSAGPLSLELGSITSLTEIPHALADALHLGEHPWVHDERNDGVVVAQFDPVGDRDSPGMKLLDEWGADEVAWDRMVSSITAATDGRWKVVRHGDREHVYDLGTDPLEDHPVVDPAGRVDDATLARLRGAVDDAQKADEVYGSSAPVETEPVEPVSADEAAALEEQMRLLGYL